MARGGCYIMALLEGTFNNFAEISRYTKVLYEGEVGDRDLHSQYGDDFTSSAKIRITLDSKQTGSVYLTGSTTETVTFANKLVKESSALFDSLEGLCTSGLTGTMKVELYDEMGSKASKLFYQQVEYCDYEEISNEDRLHNVGILSEWQAKIRLGDRVDVLNKDIINIDFDETKSYEVTQVLPIRHNGIIQYKECYLKEK
jgi:hypothetical protein